jgi:hypothetical protein
MARRRPPSDGALGGGEMIGTVVVEHFGGSVVVCLVAESDLGDYIFFVVKFSFFYSWLNVLSFA